LVALSKTEDKPTPPAPDPAPRAPVVDGWRVALACTALGWVATLVLMGSAAASMVTIWSRSETYNHGFLIVPAALYLAWEQKAVLARLTPRPAPLAILGILIGSFAWFAGDVTNVSLLGHVGLVLALQATTVAVLGWRIARVLMFPIGFLAFAIPVGDFLVPPLQDVTANFVVAGLQIIGVPVFLDGVFLQIPNGRFVVAEACAGVRFLIAMIALGALIAYMFMHTWPRRLLFMAIVCVVPVIANGFRALGIVLLGHYSDMTIAVGADHLIHGWIFFAFVMALVLGLGWFMRETPVPHAVPSGAVRAASAAHFALAALAVVAAAAAGPAVARLVAAPDEDVAVAFAPFPAGAGWRETTLSEPAWLPNFVGADATRLEAFAKDGHHVEIFAAYYASQLMPSSYRSATVSTTTRSGAAPVAPA
jgi:exosortase A